MSIYKSIIILLLSLLFIGCGKPNQSYARGLIVLDAGHGGHDPGATYAGFEEKIVVLEITKKLQKKLLKAGYDVYLTRGDDRFLNLYERTRIADRKEAKLFISIHANATLHKERFEEVEGVETYFLQKTRDEKSQRIAARENKAVLQGTDRLSKDVIIDSVLNGPKIIQSHKLAIDVQHNIMKHLHINYPQVVDGGVRPAPFYVLVGASRPSILIEVGYMSNPKERERLFTSAYQDRIVTGIVEGIGRYLQNRKAEVGF